MLKTDTDGFSIGNVNLLFGNGYGDINSIFQQNQKNTVQTSHSKYIYRKFNYSYDVRSIHAINYFGESIHLNATAFYNVDKSINFVSKIIRSGFVILTLTPNYNDTYEKFLNVIKHYYNFLNKKLNVVLIVRGCDHYRAMKEIKEKIDQFKNEINSLTENFFKSIYFIDNFNFSTHDSMDCDYNNTVHDAIKNYFQSNQNEFIQFDHNEIPFICSDLYSKNTIYTIRSIKNEIEKKIENSDLFLEKLVKSGYLVNLPGKYINQYYFKITSNSDESFLSIILRFYEDIYNFYRKGRVVRYTDIIKLIPKKIFEEKKYIIRLLLLFIQNGKLGRHICNGIFYFRKSDHDLLTNNIVFSRY